jgi:hypothetical protein
VLRIKHLLRPGTISLLQRFSVQARRLLAYSQRRCTLCIFVMASLVRLVASHPKCRMHWPLGCGLRVKLLRWPKK